MAYTKTQIYVPHHFPDLRTHPFTTYSASVKQQVHLTKSKQSLMQLKTAI